MGGTYSPVTGDFDGNGADDIYWYGSGATVDVMWWATGTRGGWTVVTGGNVEFPTTLVMTPVVGNFDGTQDIDGDGNPDPARDDIYFARYGGGTVWWGTDQATFGTVSQAASAPAATQPFAGDFDDDGRDDVFMYAAGAGNDTILWGADRTAFNTPAQRGITTPATKTSSYRYDTGGLRAAKTVAGAETEFSWTATGGLPLLLGEHTPAGSTWIIHGPGGQPIEEFKPGGSSKWLHHDQLGSIRLSTYTVNGATYRTRSYNAYGQTAAVNNATNQPILSYAGQYTDQETGYQYLRARYYDPKTGQFLTKDPLVAFTAEPFEYSTGNPLTFSDPAGLCASTTAKGTCDNSILKRFIEVFSWRNLLDIHGLLQELAMQAPLGQVERKSPTAGMKGAAKTISRVLFWAGAAATIADSVCDGEGPQTVPNHQDDKTYIDEEHPDQYPSGGQTPFTEESGNPLPRN